MTKPNALVAPRGNSSSPLVPQQASKRVLEVDYETGHESLQTPQGTVSSESLGGGRSGVRHNQELYIKVLRNEGERERIGQK